MHPPALGATKARQSGIALVIGLVLLVIMLVLGLASVRLLTSEEKMVGYTYDRTLAFQAAEAALREVEQLVEDVKPTPTPGACTGFSSGTFDVHACPAPAASDTPRWVDPAFTDWTAATRVGSGTTAVTPSYIVEYLGAAFPCGPNPTDTPACKRYRITVRAGEAGRAQAMVQSHYATD